VDTLGEVLVVLFHARRPLHAAEVAQLVVCSRRDVERCLIGARGGLMSTEHHRGHRYVVPDVGMSMVHKHLTNTNALGAVMRALVDAGRPMSVNEICESTNVSRATVADQLRERLVPDGSVINLPGGYFYSLTDAGDKAARAAKWSRATFEDRVVAQSYKTCTSLEHTAAVYGMSVADVRQALAHTGVPVVDEGDKDADLPIIVMGNCGPPIQVAPPTES
jgi:hypothetical protein